MKTEELNSALADLRSTDADRRGNALGRLGFSRDKRALPHVIRVLRDRNEAPSVRGDAAESLKDWRGRKAMRTLVECSAEPSADVRFWCVFALGQGWVGRRNEPLVVTRALEARLEDRELPWGCTWWPVGLEALAMLQGSRRSRLPLASMFNHKMQQTLRDPLGNRDQWQWVRCYVDARHDHHAYDALFQHASQVIRGAGHNPDEFGWYDSMIDARKDR
jgi:hypothetical protein